MKFVRFLVHLATLNQLHWLYIGRPARVSGDKVVLAYILCFIAAYACD